MGDFAVDDLVAGFTTVCLLRGRVARVIPDNALLPFFPVCRANMIRVGVPGAGRLGGDVHIHTCCWCLCQEERDQLFQDEREVFRAEGCAHENGRVVIVVIGVLAVVVVVLQEDAGKTWVFTRGLCFFPAT